MIAKNPSHVVVEPLVNPGLSEGLTWWTGVNDWWLNTFGNTVQPAAPKVNTRLPIPSTDLGLDLLSLPLQNKKRQKKDYSKHYSCQLIGPNM